MNQPTKYYIAPNGKMYKDCKFGTRYCSVQLLGVESVYLYPSALKGQSPEETIVQGNLRLDMVGSYG